MEKKLILKMIENSLKKYYRENEVFPLSAQDYEELYKKVLITRTAYAETELYEVIHDVVYEYITN
ncbi:YqzH family protein [Cytobacillus sp. Hz8]|uniref:YqzH family protein n=1 Tax=Cytobacillus sp. Hz8 TaxID=3347168 RepID=UPI0035E3BC07